MNITILIITHEHGINVYPCASPEIADAYLHDFVKTWWPHQFDSDEPIPNDPSTAIEDYFNCDICDESYEIITDALIETLPSEEVSA